MTKTLFTMWFPRTERGFIVIERVLFVFKACFTTFVRINREKSFIFSIIPFDRPQSTIWQELTKQTAFIKNPPNSFYNSCLANWRSATWRVSNKYGRILDKTGFTGIFVFHILSISNHDECGSCSNVWISLQFSSSTNCYTCSCDRTI